MTTKAGLWAGALLLAGVAVAQAAEPVKAISIYVDPYYRAAVKPGEQYRVNVGKSFDALLASTKREDILAARDLINAKPQLIAPMTMMVLAARLYDVGERDEAVFWFYAAKDRTIVLTEVIDEKTPSIAGAVEAVKAFSNLAGPVINGYAFCDYNKQQAIRVRELAWTAAHPYEVVFLQQLPAKGDRQMLAAQALAKINEGAGKERAYFDDTKQRDAYYATRKQNEADVKYCWK